MHACLHYVSYKDKSILFNKRYPSFLITTRRLLRKTHICPHWICGLSVGDQLNHTRLPSVKVDLPSINPITIMGHLLKLASVHIKFEDHIPNCSPITKF